MKTIDALLEKRVDGASSLKVKALAKQSSTGDLSSFSGLFKTHELSDQEKRAIEAILLHYQSDKEDITEDLSSLVAITAEVKAIHNQAVMLHGERIQRAQAVLKTYKEGAFTAWLYAAYGNRQTPYNFLLYFEFCHSLPLPLKEKADAMPRQAIYALASRKISPEAKQKFVETYTGQTKKELLELIRTSFPLALEDKRRRAPEETLICAIEKLIASYKRQKKALSARAKDKIVRTLTLFIQEIER